MKKISLLMALIAIMVFLSCGGDDDNPTTGTSVAVKSVVLDNTSLDLLKSKTTKLIATVMPEDATDKSVTWASSDETVATVDSQGNIKTLKLGETTITVTSKDGGKKASCVIKVTTTIVAVSSVTLDKTSLSLEENKTAKLTATIQPANASNKSITWTSSDETVATVDTQGNIKTLKVGQATITATSKNGGKKATCLIKVVTTAVAVSGVTLGNTNLSLQKGKTTKLTATVQPANATDKAVSWSSSDKNIATVDNQGTIKALKVGQATITVKSKDGSKKATCLIKVTTDKYKLTITATNGSVNYTGGEYSPGTVLTLEATANKNFVFKKWSGDASGNSKSLAITMNGDMNIEAEFEKIADETFIIGRWVAYFHEVRKTQNSVLIVKESVDPKTGSFTSLDASGILGSAVLCNYKRDYILKFTADKVTIETFAPNSSYYCTMSSSETNWTLTNGSSITFSQRSKAYDCKLDMVNDLLTITDTYTTQNNTIVEREIRYKRY